MRPEPDRTDRVLAYVWFAGVVLFIVVAISKIAGAQTCAYEAWDGRCMTETEYAEWTAWPTPVPDPIPAPFQTIYRGMGNGQVEQYRYMVSYFWPAAHVDRMLRIMRCESGGNPNALNTSTDVRGLFQVKYPLWSKLWPGNYYDPWTNAAIAYQIWLDQGYRAWACRG